MITVLLVLGEWILSCVCGLICDTVIVLFGFLDLLFCWFDLVWVVQFVVGCFLIDCDLVKWIGVC